MKLTHHCPRGPRVRLEPGARCVLCGGTAGQSPGDGVDLVERLRELDEREDVELNTWEAGFVDSILKRTWPLTEAQEKKAREILERHE